MKELLTIGSGRVSGVLFTRACLAAFAFITFTGCDRQEILVYEVPKEKARLEMPQTASASRQGTEARPHAHWDFVPDSWKEREPSGIRVANFVITDGDRKAEVTVIPLSGRFGTATENVNRWRNNDLKLGPLSDDQVADAAQTVPIGKLQGQLVDMQSEAAVIEGKFKARVVSAMVKQGDTMWFVKLLGEDALVRSQKEDFLKFLAGLDLHENSDADSAAPTASAPPAAPDSGLPEWTIPSGWTQVPPTAMLLAKFTANGAEATVSRFPGGGGGVLPNVNRWRKQVRLPEITEGDLSQHSSKLDTAGGEAILFDMTGSNDSGSARIVAAILMRGGDGWFYKLTGTPDAVEREKANFVQFIKSAKYRNG